MFCSNCGSEVPNNAAFCADCGNKVGTNAKNNIVNLEKIMPEAPANVENMAEAEEYRFLMRSLLAGYVGDGKKVVLKIDSENITLEYRRKIFFYTGSPTIRIIPIKDIHSLKYAKEISYFMVLLAIAIAYLAYKGSTIKLAAIATILVLGFFHKYLYIRLKNGEVIKFYRLDNADFIQPLFDKLLLINPNISLIR